MGVTEIRDKINDNPFIGYGIIGGIFAIAMIFAMVYLLGGSDIADHPDRKREWFYDLKNKKPFTGPAGANPPILTPDQSEGDEPAGVKVHYWTCGDCSDKQLGWFEKYNEEALAKIADTTGDNNYDVQSGRLVSKDGKDWVIATSDKGKALTRSFYNKCPKEFKECYPSDQE